MRMSDVVATGGLAELDFSVPGMICEGCAEKVRKALTAVPGVLEAKPSAWRKRVIVRYEPGRVGEPAITAALAIAGFDAAKL